MQTIDRETLRQKMRDNDQLRLIEVLPRDSYNDFHLPGAINVPLDEADFGERIQVAADKNEEIVVYCMDESCDASPRAAERMEQLGFSHVSDYEAGKKDWRKAGLPEE
ncbi:MAG: rhodanese-like domain-containing protein [Roseovarius sp.]